MGFTIFFYSALAVYVLIVSLPVILSIFLFWWKAKVREQERLKRNSSKKKKFITRTKPN